MLSYIIFTVVIDYFVLTCMISIIAKNQLLDFKTRVGFISSFVLILLVSTLELAALLIDDKFLEFRYLNLVFINTYLILSPLVPLLYAGAVSGFSHKSFKYALGLYILYFIFIIIAIPCKLIFHIENNRYIEAKGYPVFIATYAFFKLYLVYMCFIKLRRFQSINWFAIVTLGIGFIGGSSVQLYNSKIHTVWGCLTLILVVYYAYYNEQCRQLDEMTDLYSHQAYLSRCQRLKPGEGLVIMDCDKFKSLNDTYGHQEGDRVLIELAGIIRGSFKGYGICYRIGGDEFAVITNRGVKIEPIIDKLKAMLELEREKNPLLPTISIGYGAYDGIKEIAEFKSSVDMSMYSNKLAL